MIKIFNINSIPNFSIWNTYFYNSEVQILRIVTLSIFLIHRYICKFNWGALYTYRLLHNCKSSVLIMKMVFVKFEEG